MINSSMGIFNIALIFIGLVFVLLIGTIIFRIANFGAQKTKIKESVKAKVISKRQNVWGEHSHTDYYATFELDNGSRVEYNIPHNKIGYLVEGDKGILTFQGTLYDDFERKQNMAMNKIISDI